jgi:hypothetical protein
VCHRKEEATFSLDAAVATVVWLALVYVAFESAPTPILDLLRRES